MFIRYFKPQVEYNLKHVLKVQSVYRNITDDLIDNKVYGCSRVLKRHKEIANAIEKGEITKEEYNNWKKYQKVV